LLPEVHVSQTDAQEYRRTLQAELDDELVAHEAAACRYCVAGAACPEVYYAERAADIVKRRLYRRTVGGPS
jgi:hypothetical protein